MAYPDFWHASRSHPCPVCGEKERCSVQPSGMHFCHSTRMLGGKKGDTDIPGFYRCNSGKDRDGFIWLRREGTSGGPRNPRRHHREATAAAKGETPRGRPLAGNDASNQAKGFTGDGLPFATILANRMGTLEDRSALAEKLGVAFEAIERFEVGHSKGTGRVDTWKFDQWLFPERDWRGQVVGIATRLVRPLKGQQEKKMIIKSTHGLAYDPLEIAALAPGETVLVVEGASDVLACMTMGLHAVGRPSNTGGVGNLIPLLTRAVMAGVLVLVVGENDWRLQQKPGGAPGEMVERWPGREGAERVSGELAAGFGKTVRMAMPPGDKDGQRGVKDVRQWLNGAMRARGVLGAVPPEMMPAARQDGERLLVALMERSEAVEGVAGGLFGVPASPVVHAAPEPTTGDINPSGECEALANILQAGNHNRPCPWHSTPLLQHKTMPGRGMVIRADCWSFKCPVCDPRKRCAWALHLCGCLSVAAQNGAGLWGAVVVNEEAAQRELDRWYQQSKREKREVSNKGVSSCQLDLHKDTDAHAGARGLPLKDRDRVDNSAHQTSFEQVSPRNHLAIRRADLRVLLITDRHPGDDLTLVRLSVADATAIVAESILDLSRRLRRPISTSAAWTLPEDETQGEWSVKGTAGRGGFSAVIDRLMGMGARPTVQDWGRSERGDFHVPAGLSEEQVMLFWEHLRNAGQTGNQTNQAQDHNQGRKDLE